MIRSHAYPEKLSIYYSISILKSNRNCNPSLRIHSDTCRWHAHLMVLLDLCGAVTLRFETQLFFSYFQIYSLRSAFCWKAVVFSFPIEIHSKPRKKNVLKSSCNHDLTHGWISHCFLHCLCPSIKVQNGVNAKTIFG